MILFVFCFKWSYYLLVFCVYIYNVQNHFTSFMMLSLPHVIFKPGSSGRRQTALSPSLYLSLSWRGPLGKSSSLRLSKKKKVQYSHTLYDRSALPFCCQHLPVLFRTTGSSAAFCHTLLRVSIACPHLHSFNHL